MAAILLRIVLFAVVGLIGWLVGGAIGVFVSAGLDLLLLADEPSRPGATVTSVVWTTGMIGAVVGMVGSVMWLGIHIGRRPPE